MAPPLDVNGCVRSRPRLDESRYAAMAIGRWETSTKHVAAFGFHHAFLLGTHCGVPLSQTEAS